ncbi:MAG: hypothetical protein R2874_09795 [Desulfobacterales bacterium]
MATLFMDHLFSRGSGKLKSKIRFSLSAIPEAAPRLSIICLPKLHEMAAFTTWQRFRP